jgi:hypothetical protein
VAAFSAGLQVIDVSNPASPVRVGSYSSSSNACSVVLAGNKAYVADGTNGLEVFDISNPTNLVAAGSYNTGGFAEKVFLSGNYVCLADGPAGLLVLQVYGFPNDPPRLAQAPQSQTVTANAAAVLSVSAQGAEPLHYQWQLGGTNVPGATQATLPLAAVTGSQTGAYSVIVSNLSGSVTSAPTMLALLQPPQFDVGGTNAPGLASNLFRCGLATQPGVTYAVEYKPAWQSNWVLLRIVAGDGAPVTITDPSTLAPCRFYRARVL